MPDGVVQPFSAESGREWLHTRATGSPTLVYKHSPICGTSRRAEAEVREWAQAHPEVPVVQLDVVRQRSLSRELAEMLHVGHESPQAILLDGRRVVWHGSHGRVNLEELEDALLGFVKSRDAAT